MEDKYSVESAEALANEALRLPITEAVPKYEQLLATFPTAAKYWKQYVEAHMAVNNDDATKQIFSRCLLNCLQIPLWRCYINFIRKANEKKGLEGQEETRKAFEFMLGYVGSDIGSGPVWTDYINFLKSLPAQNPQEESQRMIAVRKVYQKAIVTPTHHIEQHWRDYENFENSVSRALAKGLVSEYQPKYNSARAVYRERKKYFDEIDWNMLAVPPSGSVKEELQWTAWKRFLAFEKENPQRIDTVSANKRISFTYEQCLMYLYHYPDIWFDYATWHAKCGSIDSAIKVYQRSLKALPDCALLRYAYAELEESRGAIQAAKKVYESLLGDGANATALSHIQFIRFLRRTEGVEAAKKYFLDARNSPNCTYHVYVAYATMAFCMDKDVKYAHSVFEAGLKTFKDEPGYILEYADFLSRLNDDRNIRALFERALSSLSPKDSIEVWKRFSQFEQTYGDLASMLKVEQRRKDNLAIINEGASALENSLQDVVSRYSFMDLWPCSSNELEHLSRQDWLSSNMKKKVEKSTPANEADKTSGQLLNSNVSSKLIYPDISRMVVYDPRQKPGLTTPGLPSTAGPLPSSSAPSVLTTSGVPAVPNVIPKALPPALAAFIASLPPADGPLPDVDYVLSICLQSTLPVAEPGKLAQVGPASSDVSGSSKSHLFKPRDRHGKKREADRQDDDDTSTVQSQPLPKDAFKIRQLRKARVAAGSVQTGAASYGSVQTGSASYGSGFSGEQSGSYG
ncbi:putative suppressor of forked, tetratricopeptide-like helical domain superfamily [Helianthus annuus]|uniref:Putative tetratricopeptide repeat (TPR)-like superfamily protein n=1 Tax=Helianthus annuus TaxID=4232 RepID=A0A251V6T2_HELAN|nr:cleavage stimulation factor subunit 77 [Helianthus annuus]KAF5814394.1 putative suppressor of forked, tetratricopeptide-like helical domain superfamily [Helianthus annuus]KAJ0600776.1 putative suppressor of forked, tetratricopeptide-like helical domain superfamily [Helianthus annuus]KAJ0773873.1 putative suppressor of forked, tetratricopeptide-like helical domain superfamily [Helianthus annuus]KAJ0935613.1 putative suppressor of forked, tetratricopeptide-like helical domain superfamily [Heli